MRLPLLRTQGALQRLLRVCSAAFGGGWSDLTAAPSPCRPAQREAAARFAANLAAKTAKRGGLARAVADGLGACSASARPPAAAPAGSHASCAADPPSTSPLELGSALVAAAWVAGFAVVASLVQRRTRGGDDES